MQKLNKIIFWSLIGTAQFLAIVTYILMHTWLVKYTGGFNWNSYDSKHVQNFHALFMTLGFLLLFGEATIMYRLIARFNTSYLFQKVIHVIVLTTASVFWIIGLAAAFKARFMDKKNNEPVKEFYSFHSWIGFILLMIFISQFFVALIWYMNIRRISKTFQVQYKAFHVFNGVFLFSLSTATCFTGVSEVGLLKVPNYGELPTAGIHLNMTGLTMLAFAAVIGYILYKPEFKLTPDIEEDKAYKGVQSAEENGKIQEENTPV